MKICHLGPTAIPVLHQKGGAVQRRMLELASIQASSGDEVVILTADDHNGEIERRGVRIVSLHTRASRPARDYEYLLRVRSALRAERVDIVHHHGLPEGARVIGRKVPSVLSFDYFQFRGSERAVGWRHYRRSLGRFARLLPVSEACADMAAEFWKHPREQYRVLANGVNLTQFAPDPPAGRAFRAQSALDDRPVAMYVGRLCEQKGTDLLLDAWEQLGDDAARWQLALAGPIGQFGFDGQSELVDRLEALGGAYLGAVDEAQIGAAFNACDVFVMPTRHAEMFGMAALEAEACGKPVVASRWGGLTEAVSADSGDFFEPNDAEALAKALGALLDDPARRARMGAAARQHAHTYDWSAIATRAAEIYREVLR